MTKKVYWADKYVENKMKADEAMKHIRSGQRIFIGSTAGEPQYLVKSLADASNIYNDLEIVRVMAAETVPLSLIAEKTHDHSLNIRQFYIGSAKVKDLSEHMRFITPINLSAIPRLFNSRKLPIHVALIQVTPPDDFGWMSLGVSVDVAQAAALSADLVIAQVNSKMPRVLGRSFIHVNDVDIFVEHDEELISLSENIEIDTATSIARHMGRLVADGSTLQIGLGPTPRAMLLTLSEKNDLGVHSQFITDGIMHLYAKGIITNKKKRFNDGKIIAGTAFGTSALYEFLNDNPVIEFHPSDYVNDVRNISRNSKMVSMNLALAVDLTGQAAADALPFNHYSGVTGILDFVRGSALSEGGKSILFLPSTTINGESSRIMPFLDDTAVVVPRSDVNYIVTEYGAVNLFGKSLQERAVAMISIAHPKFRDELFQKAKERGFLGAERILRESIKGIYPLRLEEKTEVGDEVITIRPAKPVDERRIQEHFYTLEKDDVISRFFHQRTSFVREYVEGLSQIDYIENLTLIAVVGEYGFDRVVGVGEYLLDHEKNLAEVAFSVSKDFQGKGLGKILIRRLCQAARESGIVGLYAYTSPNNKAMVKVFKSLPYEVTTVYDGDMLLTLNFNKPK